VAEPATGDPRAIRHTQWSDTDLASGVALTGSLVTTSSGAEIQDDSTRVGTVIVCRWWGLLNALSATTALGWALDDSYVSPTFSGGFLGGFQSVGGTNAAVFVEAVLRVKSATQVEVAHTYIFNVGNVHVTRGNISTWTVATGIKNLRPAWQRTGGSGGTISVDLATVEVL